ncbi:MAG: DUF58 domain-containing protein [Gemmatimonadetes bacterium]|nr:DUF58 domain-containing protein [Gemmatimonadota bacterium]
MDVLSPAVVTAIDDLELAARVLVEGLRVGGHRSPFHGYGAEFHQHRPYRAGDDLKYLDWKLYARTNRLYTRQFRETTNVAVMLVLDTSASMAFPAEDVATMRRGDGPVSKFRYAVVVAAALAYLASEQGNAVGLMTMTDGEMVYLPARSGRVHLRALLATLDRLRPSGAWQPATVIGRAAELLARRGLLMVLSDFYDDEDGTRRELRHVVQRGHDVAMLQVVAGAERTLPYREALEVEELETGARRLVEPDVVREGYRRAMAAFLDGTQAAALHEGMDYACFDTAVPVEHALRDYLVRRAMGAQAALQATVHD